jgi:serine protease Do
MSAHRKIDPAPGAAPRRVALRRQAARAISFALLLLLAAFAATDASAQEMERLTRNTFADLADQTRDAVVAVELVKFQPYARRTSTSSSPRRQAGSSDAGYYQTHGGSGVIVSEDGVIVTSRHIVANRNAERDTLRIRLADGTLFEGEQVQVLGEDTFTDTAVLKIPGSGYTALPWGDSRATRVGEWVMVIGNPLDFEFSFSQGIVSGLHRMVDSQEIAIEDLIQTTAVINRGTSGGAMVDLDGRLAGVVTAIATTGDSWQGLGFAMPQHVLQPVVESIVRDGFVRRGYLGITMELVKRVDPGARAANGRDVYEGVLVTDVLVDYPAMTAGVRAGDMIVSIDGSAVRAIDDIYRLVGTRAPGEYVRLELTRDGGRESLDVELAERPEDGEITQSMRRSVSRPRDESFLPPRLMAPMTAQAPDSVEPAVNHFEELGLALAPRHDGALGLIVLRVRSGSPADRAGLIEGDILLEVDGEVARGLSDCRQKLAATVAAGGFSLRAQREGEAFDFRLTWPLASNQ